MFKNVEKYDGDPILSLTETFHNDPRPDKVNLGIGLYHNEEGMVPEFHAITMATECLAREHEGAQGYLPMAGLTTYRDAVGKLLFGAQAAVIRENRVATIQTIGGTGALKIGADFLHQFLPKSDIWLSEPTYENHPTIFGGAGLKVHYYPYYDPKTKELLFDKLCDALQQLPSESIVLFHPCCHNPTGVDLTKSQWDTVIALLKKHHLIPFLDFAYQGFGEGIDEDCCAIREMAKAGLTCFISNSFSKNFSMYGARVGALSVICRDKNEKERVLSQLEAIVRRNYSSPPAYGAKRVEYVLTDPRLFKAWSQELDSMRRRLVSLRKQLADELGTLEPSRDFSYLIRHRGLFSCSGMSPAQVTRLREEHGIYVLNSGRMCLAGLTSHNLERVARALVSV